MEELTRRIKYRFNRWITKKVMGMQCGMAELKINDLLNDNAQAANYGGDHAFLEPGCEYVLHVRNDSIMHPADLKVFYGSCTNIITLLRKVGRPTVRPEPISEAAK